MGAAAFVNHASQHRNARGWDHLSAAEQEEYVPELPGPFVAQSRSAGLQDFDTELVQADPARETVHSLQERVACLKHGTGELLDLLVRVLPDIAQQFHPDLARLAGVYAQVKPHSKIEPGIKIEEDTASAFKDPGDNRALACLPADEVEDLRFVPGFPRACALAAAIGGTRRSRGGEASSPCEEAEADTKAGPGSQEAESRGHGVAAWRHLQRCFPEVARPRQVPDAARGLGQVP